MELDPESMKQAISNVAESAVQATVKRVKHNFMAYTPQPEEAAYIQKILARGEELSLFIVSITPPSREQSLALTEIENAVDWARKAVERNGLRPYLAAAAEVATDAHRHEGVVSDGEKTDAH